MKFWLKRNLSQTREEEKNNVESENWRKVKCVKNEKMFKKERKKLSEKIFVTFSRRLTAECETDVLHKCDPAWNKDKRLPDSPK